MSISTVINYIDDNGHETVEHGSSAFPISCYQGDLNEREVRWHWHEELEAAVITKGRCLISVGNRKYTLQAGDGFFINSGVLHGAVSADSAACHFHSIVFHSRLVGGNTDSIFHQNYVSPLIHDVSLEGVILSPDIPWHKRILTVVNNAWQTCAEENPGYEFVARSQLSELVFQLLSNRTEANISADQGSVRNITRTKQMLQFIHENYGSELNISSIADAASVSSSECLRCFKSTIGMTPVQYLRQYRLQRACQLLLTTTVAISEIAVQCGFKDVSYFTKTFREIKGKTPGEYRRNQG